MLSFVQGNPDRPYISGVMHDSAHPDHILATDYQKSQLNLGHIVDSNRNKRGENGEGFELRTDGWGAVRAGKGIPEQEKTKTETLYLCGGGEEHLHLDFVHDDKMIQE